MTDYAIFALVVEGISLHQIKPTDLAVLLQNFGKMLGEDNLFFDEFRSASTHIQLKTPLVYAEEKTQNIHKAISGKSSSFKVIQQLANKHADWQIDIRLASNDDLNLYTFEPESKGFSFKQAETLRGQLRGLIDGNDKTDHFSLRLEDGRTVSITCHGELLKNLAPLIKTGSLLEITGEAKYHYISFNDIHLEGFEAQSFTVLEQVSMASWLKGFIGDGQTEWSTFDDPVEQWLQERHS